MKRRAFVSSLAASPAALSSLLWSRQARAAIGPTLTVAYNVAPPGFDPNSGSYATSPGLQSIFKTLYDPYFEQAENLSLQPGVMDQFSWSSDRNKISMRLRQGVTWHDGKPVTIDDVIWNLRRLGDPAAGNPLSTVFASIKNIAVHGNLVTFDVQPWRANMLERLSFLACYLIPPHYYQQVGKEGFEKRPMGSGPYIFDQFERGSFLRLKANPHYWNGKPAFDTVVFKFVTDPASRVAEIERGTSDITLDVPYEEYDRLRKKPGLVGVAHPISDIAMLFLNNEGVMQDANVRKAAAFAIDKKLIVSRLNHGLGMPLDTLLAPQYKGYDPSIKTAYDPALAQRLLKASGYSPEKPVEFTIQTTRGYKPKDYETVQVIAEMWRKVGIKANVEVYEIAKHFELRAQHKLAPAAFYDWGNSTADPESSLGTAMVINSPHSSWKTADVDSRITPLFEERDEAKRIAGYKAVNAYIAENAYVIPLFQFYQPVVYKRELKFTPHMAGHILPAKIGACLTAQMAASFLYRRLMLAIPTLFGVALTVFVLLRVVPGDPVAMMISGESTPQDIERLRAQYGLDKSIPQQFVIFLKDVVTGHLGTSISLKQDVLELVLGRLPATLELAVVAILISLVVGFVFALSATYWRGTVLETAIDAVNSVALAIPEFLWALLLVLGFGVAWPVLPLDGRIDPSHSFDFSTQFYLLESLAKLRFSDALQLLEHLILPATALALPLLAVIARVLKSSLLEANVQDYILLARVKGFSRPRVLLQHALPNALLPTITLTGVNFVFLVGGTVLVELIFAYPGIGNLLYTAAINRDLPLIQGVTIVFAVIFVLMNIAIDLLHSALNVRAHT